MYHNIKLVFDPRNKETHNKRPFKQYLETEIFGTGVEIDLPITMKIDSYDSNVCYGLQAADFCSWAIFRKYETGDSKYFDIIAEKIKFGLEWIKK